MAAYTTSLTWDSVASYLRGETRLKQFTNETESSHPEFDAAVAAASLYIDQKIGKAVTVPLDDPLPEPLGSYARALVVHFLTMGSDRRSDSIEQGFKHADDYLSGIATGRITLADTNTGTTSGAALSRYVSAQPDEVFSDARLDLMMPKVFP